MTGSRSVPGHVTAFSLGGTIAMTKAADEAGGVPPCIDAGWRVG